MSLRYHKLTLARKLLILVLEYHMLYRIDIMIIGICYLIQEYRKYIAASIIMPEFLRL